jgi:hypothetical protein
MANGTVVNPPPTLTGTVVKSPKPANGTVVKTPESLNGTVIKPLKTPNGTDPNAHATPRTSPPDQLTPAPTLSRAEMHRSRRSPGGVARLGFALLGSNPVTPASLARTFANHKVRVMF